MDGKQDYDVLAFIYEYLIGMFAANAGKKAGEFYTPHEVSLLMSELIAHHVKDKKEILIYDPTSGSGSLLINIGQSVAKHIDDDNNIKYYAQELKQNTYNLTRMNLVMRGILPGNIVTRNGDTLEDDWPFFDESDPTNSYNPLYLDAVVSNPPYSQKWEPEHKDTDPRYARFGLAPKTKADYAFLLHDLYHLKPDGMMTIVLPHGVLFRGGEEGNIRKKLIEYNHIDAIIGLPANIFFGTGIPTIIIVLKQKREYTDVLIVDASKGFIKVGKNNKLRASDIKRISDTVIARQTIPNYSKQVSRDHIRANDYNLNIPRYVDSSEPAESWDIYATMFGGIPEHEINALAAFWQAFPNLRAALFTATSSEYAALTVDDIKAAITGHPDVQAFAQDFATAFADFAGFLKQELLTHLQTVNIPKEINVLSDELFKRLSTIALIDKYQAYQLLDDHWASIAIDLEILQSEGFAASTQVDPNLVAKKKDGKDQQVQDGWQGHIFPFELVQQNYLTIELQQLKTQENRLADISAELEEILDSLSEEEKASDIVNEAGDAFVANAVAKEAKQLKIEAAKQGAFAEDSQEAKILNADALINEEKALKKHAKTAAAHLHLKTKATIEGLTESQVYALLEQKWLSPLLKSLQQLPTVLIQTLTNQVQALADKYATTYAHVAQEIQTTEGELASMIDELTGNDFDMQGLGEFKAFLKGELNG
jgi:type I restriction enzyme M protein